MYIVWHKAEYQETWERFDCSTREEVTAKVLELVRMPGDIEVTTPLTWGVNVELTDMPAVAVPSPEPVAVAAAKGPEDDDDDETPKA